MSLLGCCKELLQAFWGHSQPHTSRPALWRICPWQTVPCPSGPPTACPPFFLLMGVQVKPENAK